MKSRTSIAQAGGRARILKHGNPGTLAGRRRGGIRSLITHRIKQTGFKTLRTITEPARSADLAELLGIIAGDGHVDTYQTTVTTNSETDMAHALYAKRLFEKLFGITVALRVRHDTKACVVVMSSKAACDFLVANGMVRGNKVYAGLCMPQWVSRKTEYRHAFTRGLFDTDGSVYVDTHTIRGKVYRNACLVFTNRSGPLLSDFKSSLEAIGLHPTQKTKYAVFLRRAGEIQHYFATVGTSNPKHIGRLGVFLASPRRGA